MRFDRIRRFSASFFGTPNPFKRFIRHNAIGGFDVEF